MHNIIMSEYLFRYSEPKIRVASAKGTCVIAEDGKEYLDFKAGWCVGNAGWNNEEIMKAIREFNGPVFVNITEYYERWETLAEKLVSLMPNRNYTCFRGTGGTEAVELSLKIAKAYNRRKKFVAFNDAYHGQSFAAMALVGLHEDRYGPYGNNYVRIGTEWEKATKEALKAIRSENVCAFISEPIICNLGVIVPPKEFMREVREACSDTNTVFIMDEVMTGFGRTGKWFGFEHHKLEPDVITIAKGFSGGHGVISAAIAKKEIAESMDFYFSNASTFGWQPLSVEAAIANISYIEKKRLVEKSRENGEYFMKRLLEFTGVRGKGLCIAAKAKTGTAAQCLEDGLIVGDLGKSILLCPPLEVTRKELDEAMEILQKNV